MRLASCSIVPVCGLSRNLVVAYGLSRNLRMRLYGVDYQDISERLKLKGNPNDDQPCFKSDRFDVSCRSDGLYKT